jgi:ABC-2 type transport system ATP-binding protein
MTVSSQPSSDQQVPAPPDAGTDQTQPPADQPTWAPDAAIETQRASKRFGDTWVVKNLTFSVRCGTIFGLFGPSGSGKTTTIRMMLGLLGLDEGDIRVLGVSPRRFRARTRARIGYMPQHFVLYPELTVSENLHLAASLYGMGWLKRREPMRQVLDFVELSDHRGKTCDTLSGGMQRRLELAAALVHSPDLIVMDEPTAGVDPILRAKFWDRFRELRDQGRTLFVTSQYVTEAEYCDAVAVLGRGQLVAIGTPDELRRRAIGGELVDVVTDGLDRSLFEALRDLPVVNAAKRVSYEEVQLTVDEAGAAIPPIMEALAAHGAAVKQVQEYRPNFDEVFVRLMEQSDVESVE